MNWRRWFQPHIIDRGFAYYQDGAVQDYQEDYDSIQANVQGNSEYHVHIDIINGSIHDMECDCPYADNGNNCKHMVAVLFYMEHEMKDTTYKNKKKKYDYNDGESKLENSIHNLVETADKNIVNKFLVDILENDEKLYRRFKSIIRSEILPEDITQYKNLLNRIFREYAGRDGFIEYYKVGSFINELENFLTNDIEGMMANQQYTVVFKLTNYIFVEIGNQDMDDSSGETGMLIDMCFDIWKEILIHGDQRLKKDMFRWCMKHLNGSVIDYMEEYLERFIFENFKGKEFLDEKFTFTAEKISKYKEESDSWLRSYYGGKWAVRYIELMKQGEISQDKIWEYCKENMDFAEVRKYYVAECIRNKKYEDAIQVLKEGKEKDQSLAGLVVNYSLQLKDLFKLMGKQEDYIGELWLLLLNYKAGDVTIFKELKALYSNEEWIEKREIIFKKLPRYAVVENLYKEEGLFDRLLKRVLDTPGLYKLIEYEKYLSKIYPDEILTKYEMEVNEMANYTSDRKHYRELVEILKKMQGFPGGIKKVDEIKETWKNNYRNRPAMMDELRKL